MAQLCHSSSADQKGASCAEHFGANLIEVALSQQSRRRSVVELWVHSLEPRARYGGVIGGRDHQRHL
jgi:hypothetical protein